MNTYIYTHLGLGDQIICNAIIRFFENRYGPVFTFAKTNNVESVQFMFRDIAVTVVEVDNDDHVKQILRDKRDDRVICIGHCGNRWNDYLEKESFDQVFYQQAGVPFEERWNGFKYVQADNYPSPMLNPLEEPYEFFHDDPSRGFFIRRPEYEFGIGLAVKPLRDIANNIFLWDRVISAATEIHCINSSFLLLADSIPTTGKLFYHRYARREGGAFGYPRLKKNWTIID